MWCKAEFSASLLQAILHDPSEIILKCWFIINIENRCAFFFFIIIILFFWNPWYFFGGSLINKK